MKKNRAISPISASSVSHIRSDAKSLDEFDSKFLSSRLSRSGGTSGTSSFVFWNGFFFFFISFSRPTITTFLYGTSTRRYVLPHKMETTSVYDKKRFQSPRDDDGKGEGADTDQDFTFSRNSLYSRSWPNNDDRCVCMQQRRSRTSETVVRDGGRSVFHFRGNATFLSRDSLESSRVTAIMPRTRNEAPYPNVATLRRCGRY